MRASPGSLRLFPSSICRDHFPHRTGPKEPATAEFSTQLFHDFVRLWRLSPTSSYLYMATKREYVSHAGETFSAPLGYRGRRARKILVDTNQGSWNSAEGNEGIEVRGRTRQSARWIGKQI